MHKPVKIRVLALGLIREGSRIFVSEGYDPARSRTFYRAMGGGVDFGETSLEALKREFHEEIQAELTNIQYLGCLENLFVYNDQPGHELIQLYQCDFADPKFYQVQQLIFAEGKRQKRAVWMESDRFKNKELTLFPDEFIRYL
jgi:8-oxo-dGTP pyrophosphatase MutT (NUDIX family)